LCGINISCLEDNSGSPEQEGRHTELFKELSLPLLLSVVSDSAEAEQ
jgi:hypothetical protein